MKGCETSAALPVLGIHCGEETGGAAYTSDWDWATSLEMEESRKEEIQRYSDLCEIGCCNLGKYLKIKI